jgi:hypothetical protein
LQDGEGFAAGSRNPRAIWCRLDELTEPSPDGPEFYMQLGEKVLELARDAAMPANRLATVRAGLPSLAEKMSQNLAQAAVREFIKRMASDITRSN